MMSKKKLPINEDLAWIKLGDRVRYKHRDDPIGTRFMGEGFPDTAWLCVGVEGVVIELHTGYPWHRCPDHHLEPDCTCGESGWVQPHAAWAVVEYQTDKPDRTFKRAIVRDGEGESWERVS